VSDLEKNGMIFTGQSEDGNRMEVMELNNHPYYVGVQYHPEYLSRPTKPSAPYVGFIMAASSKLKTYLKNLANNTLPATSLLRKKSIELTNGNQSDTLND
jgi:hypothetical protein